MSEFLLINRIFSWAQYTRYSSRYPCQVLSYSKHSAYKVLSGTIRVNCWLLLLHWIFGCLWAKQQCFAGYFIFLEANISRTRPDVKGQSDSWNEMQAEFKVHLRQSNFEPGVYAPQPKTMHQNSDLQWWPDCVFQKRDWVYRGYRWVGAAEWLIPETTQIHASYHSQQSYVWGLTSTSAFKSQSKIGLCPFGGWYLSLTL